MNNKKNNIMSNVSERDKKILFLLGSILVLALAYFFVFTPNQTKSSELSEENEQLEKYVAELDRMWENADQKNSEIITFNEKREALLTKFPAGMTYEKVISILYDLEEKTDLYTTQDTISLNTIFFDQADARTNNTVPINTSDDDVVSSPYAIQVEEGKIQKYNDIATYKTTLTVAFSCTDQQLTDAFDYINENADKMSVETVTVGFDESTGNLSGTMNISFFAIRDGLESQTYEAPSISGITEGVKNIFGSQEIARSKKNQGTRRPGNR